MAVNCSNSFKNHYLPILYQRTHLKNKQTKTCFLSPAYGFIWAISVWGTAEYPGVDVKDESCLFEALVFFQSLRYLRTACEKSTHLSFPEELGSSFQLGGWLFLNAFELPTSLFFTEKNYIVSVSVNLLDTTKKGRTVSHFCSLQQPSLGVVAQPTSAASVLFQQQPGNPSSSLVLVSLFSGVWMLVMDVKCFSYFLCSDECLYERNWDRTGSLQAKKDDAVMLLFTQMWEVVFINIS